MDPAAHGPTRGQLVYNGELEGIARALEYAGGLDVTGRDIRVYADNQAALYRLQNPSGSAGQQWQLRAIRASQRARNKGNKVSINWVPGHMDVLGNEEADSLAKQAAESAPQENQTSLAMVRVKARSILKEEWLERLASYAEEARSRNPQSYACKYRWRVGKTLRIPPAEREPASAYYQLKLGHGYLKSYLHRFKKSTNDRCTCVGAPAQTPRHLLLECSLYSEQRAAMLEKLRITRPNLADLLHTAKGISSTLEFLKSTRVSTRTWYSQTQPETVL